MRRGLTAMFATISQRMRFNLFSHSAAPQPEQTNAAPPAAATSAPYSGKTFPADEIVWGIVIRNGFDELDDPGYHRGTTQHAYLEGNDNVAICGFRPPQSGPRTRRRPRLGLPTPGQHPMCGMCARLVVAPRPRVPVPVRAARPPVAVPVTRPPVPAARVTPWPGPEPAPTAPGAAPHPAPVSPWVNQRTAAATPSEDFTSIELGRRHDGGLLERGVHTDQHDD